MEPHVGIICSSCNTQDKIYVDADGYSRDHEAVLTLGLIFSYPTG
jgi:hypothetical protein